jgi:hypothetical protein
MRSQTKQRHDTSFKKNSTTTGSYYDTNESLKQLSPLWMSSSLLEVELGHQSLSSSSANSEDEAFDNPEDKSFAPEFSCKYCNKSFFFYSECRQHMKTEHSDKLTSTTRSKPLASKSQGELHKKRSYTRGAGKANKKNRSTRKQCDICMQYVWDVETHIRTRHTHERPFACTYCAMSFTSQQILKAHTERVHERKYIGVCRFCGKGCFSNSELQCHERTHTGEKPYSCNICKKSFYNNSTLKAHAAVHIAATNFECDICKKKFKTQSANQDHQKSHFERQFKCHLCGKGYLKNSALQVHILSHSNVKPYQCDMCSAEYYRKYELVNHMNKSHLHPKPQICEFCGRRYQTKFNRLRHIKAAHKDSSGLYVICDLCGKSYANYNSLMYHKLKSHVASNELSGPQSDT